jgi:hypothetical protein
MDFERDKKEAEQRREIGRQAPTLGRTATATRTATRGRVPGAPAPASLVVKASAWKKRPVLKAYP